MKQVLAFLSLPLLAQQGVNFYSIEKEVALGAGLASEIRKQSQPLAVPEADAYAKRIGAQLVARLAERPFDYTFEATSTSGSTEPLALPGGYVFIPARFFVAAQDEGEFVGMVAHSIGHIALRHGTRTATRGQIANLSSVPLIFTGGWAGAHADTNRQSTLLPMGFLQFQREHELEADRFGVELAARAGFDAAGLRRYVERVQLPDTGLPHLPARDVRLARMDEGVRVLPTNPVSPTDFLRVRDAVRMALGQDRTRQPPTLRR